MHVGEPERQVCMRVHARVCVCMCVCARVQVWIVQSGCYGAWMCMEDFHKTPSWKKIKIFDKLHLLAQFRFELFYVKDRQEREAWASPCSADNAEHRPIILVHTLAVVIVVSSHRSQMLLLAVHRHWWTFSAFSARQGCICCPIRVSNRCMSFPTYRLSKRHLTTSNLNSNIEGWEWGLWSNPGTLHSRKTIPQPCSQEMLRWRELWSSVQSVWTVLSLSKVTSGRQDMKYFGPWRRMPFMVWRMTLSKIPAGGISFPEQVWSNLIWLCPELRW